MNDSQGPSRAQRVQRAWPTFLFWGLGTALVIWVGHEAFSTQLAAHRPQADFWEHAAALRALMEDGPGAGAPMVDSEAGSPRYTPQYVLIAGLGRFLRLDAFGAMALAATLSTAVLVIGAWCFFRALFHDPRAPLYGLIVLFCSWYDAWNYSNVYQLRLLFDVASFPSTAALGLSWIVLALGIRATRSGSPGRPGRLIAIALLLAVITATHPLTAMLPLVGLSFLAVTAPGIRPGRRGWVLLTVGAGVLLAFLWPCYPVLGVILGTGDGGPTWIERPVSAAAGAGMGFDSFYVVGEFFRTFGLATLGVIPLIHFLFVRRLRFVTLSALVLAIPYGVNLVVPIPLGHRFILLALFFLQVGLVWLLLWASPGSRERKAPATPPPRWRDAVAMVVVLGVLGTMAGKNFQKANAVLQQQVRKSTPAERDAVRGYGRRVAELAGGGAVVLGDLEASWPLPAFGVRIVAHLHINPLVPDRYRRVQDVEEFLGGGLTEGEAVEVLSRYGVTHVITRRDAPVTLLDFLGAREVRSDPLPGGRTLHSLR